ncbi:hypothetical protein NX722_00125 [Endozoicomonas gorgoniicola]|uniref:Uncharacterized protein n=1 Tax=Endozoicomonas gorgoniicola TaxID=1234144 RepID=A0ABT3MNY8_9GAMM|nr:hypothetical protein [Endozoicomonas gorgoniicola]MCW7551092.1 hypothetical protein [Endozoicomonas gorgoniicola]
MSHVIRIPAKIYNRLEQHAQGFDTPANVIEKLLNHYEGLTNKALESSEKRKKDTTKYIFRDSAYGKSRLVHAVIREHVLANPDISYEELKHLFPKSIQGSTGVFNDSEYVEEKYKGKTNKRHFIKDNDLIQLTDCKITVSTEWGAGNINGFLQSASSLGYEIIPSSDG